MVYMYEENVYSVTSEPCHSSSRRVSSFKDSLEILSRELHKSEVVLIARALLVVKAENIYWKTINIHKTIET